MQPTTKSPEIEAFLEGSFGRTTAVNANKCIPAPIGCGRQIDPGEIETWDGLTVQEYRISGFCKGCQDEVFGAGE